MCKSTSLVHSPERLTCGSCNSVYPVWQERPVLLRPDNAVFDAGDYSGPTRPSKSSLSSRFPSPSVNLSYARSIERIAEMLPETATILVVGAGVQRSRLDPSLSGVGRTIIYCDVDVHAAVDLFCDAHDLPFIDGCVDAVITTAVLEHVLYPERVAEEICRVTRLGGLLYSELPFMQQVHEGAFDFTRFTLSGHRRLFSQFREIDSGMVAGPGTALAWTLENFLIAFARGTRARKVLTGLSRLAFGWVKYFDYLLKDRPEALDGASGTYFIGSRSERKVSDLEIIQSYAGGKHLSHT